MQYKRAVMAAVFLGAVASLAAPGAGQVTSVTVVEKAGATTANYPMTVSMIFKQGDVASHVTAVVGGQNLTTQTDVKVRWPDNSVKHALVSFVIPSVPASGSVTVNFNSGGTNANTNWMTKAQLLATDFDARMAITPSGGGTTTITARNLLNGIANPEYWIKGDVCTEFLIRDFSQNISNQLNVQYYVRVYPGWSGFRVDTVVENCWTEYRGNLTYDFDLKLGNSNPQSVFTKTAFTHNFNARWRKIFWQGTTPPAVEVRYNLAYLNSTKFLPNYDTSLVVPEATISSAYSGWQSSAHDIMQNGLIMTYFPTTGGRQEIGLHPTWAARYLISMDNRMREITLNCGDLSGSIPIHLREGNPAKSAKNHVMTIDDRPTVWSGWWDYTYQDPADKLPAPVGSTTTEWSVDNAHQAAFGQIPYMITGEFYYLEEMYFWGGWDLSNSNHAYRGDAQGLINDQARGDAWAIRNISDAAWFAPDDQTLEKNYFTNKTDNNINNWVNRYITTGNYPSIRYWQDQSNYGSDGGRPDSDLVSTCRYYTSPWQDDFVLAVLTHMRDAGWSTSNLVDWLGASIINRFHHPDYNWYRGAPYHIGTQYDSGGGVGARYATWLDVDNAFVAQPGPTDFPNPDYAGSYNYIARGALGGVVHLTDGQTTWNWLDSHLYSKSTMNDDPTWGILPSGYTPPTDTTAPAAVSNLATSSPTSNSITLTWTAPGDDGNSGTATSYDIRYRTGGAVNDSNWASATQVTGEPAPQVAGTNQNMVVGGLNPSTTYYFAIKTSDEVPNTSAISNSPSGTTTAAGDTTAPAAVSNLATSSPTSDSITLTWTAPGDDDNSGTAASYDIRYRTGGAVDDGNWASASQVTGEPAPQVAGTNQNMVVGGLSPSTTYYFAIKTSDEVPNTSAISNSPSGTTTGGVLQVGPGKTYSTVQAAVNAAVDGNTIEIYPSTYTQSAGWATINKNNLILRGMDSPRPILDANGSCLSGKAIFVITGSGTTVENLEFKNARNTVDLNAAGIRQEGANLTVRNCYFHDNDDGILGNAVAGSTVLVETSEFNHNGYGNGSSHNIYFNAVDSLTIRYCYIHDANVGHEIKTRAAVNYILYNRIGNEGGTGSYEVQLANGGTSYVIGNQIEQSSTTGNPIIIDFGSEGSSADMHLYVVNNTIVNNRSSGSTFVNNVSTTTALLENNIFQGTGTIVSGPNTQTTNWATSNANLVDPVNYDFHLTAGSTGAIDAGTTPGTGINGFNMNPVSQYVHPCSYQARPTSGTLDIGGYEYLAPMPTVQFSLTSSSGSESVTSVNLTVTLNQTSTDVVTVNYAVTGGTATEGSDYTLPATGSTIVALKRDAGLVQGGAIASQFTTLDAGDVVLATVKDAQLWGSGNATYQNFGLTTSVEGTFAIAFDLSSYANATVNKAQLRLNSTQGNNNMQIAPIKSHDWPEGNKNGDYPGVAPAAPGVTWANPSATNVSNSGPLGWGTNSDSMFSLTSDGQDLYTLVNFTSMPGGAAWCVAEMTTYVQDWVSSAKPNYGVFISTGNHKPYLSEGGTDNQPVLFLDVSLPERKVTFQPGETSKTIPITVIDDAAAEGNETIQITLSSPVNATLGTNIVHTYTINDNDVPTVQFSQVSSSGSESTTSVNIPVTLSASSGQTVTVNYAVTGGTATGGGTDYTVSGTQLTFNPGVTTQNIAVTVNNDTLDEDDETIIITLSSPVNATLGANTTHTYTIADDDAAPTVQFSTTSSSGSESVTSVNLAVTLSAASGKTVTVNYAATGGTATSPGDYTISGTSLTFNPGVTSQNVPITVVDDAAVESNETIIVTLSSPTNATLGTNTTHTYTINDNDLPTVQFSQASSSGSESTTSVNIPVTLSASSSQTVTVQYAVTGGTATGGGTDYTISGTQLTFNPGVTTQNIPVTINNDSLDESDETIVITLSSPTNATLGSPTTHTYTINDDDAAPTVQFSTTSSSGSESATSVTLAVTLSAASGQTVTVQYAATGGTATGGGVDYTISGTQLTFTPGQISQNVPITVVDDALVESDETIIVTLSSPTNATLGANAAHTYTITDNDTGVTPTVQFSTTSSSGSEATSPANLTVTLSQSSSQTITVDYSVTGGTATEGSDYTLPAGGGNYIIALKRDAGLVQGGAIDSRFTGLTGANVVTTTVKDAQVWGAGDARYQNFGVTTQIPSGSGGAQGVLAWDLSAYAGGTVGKAQIRFKCTMGNNLMQIAAVKSHDWVEGNKDGNYPGVAPSAPGVTWANPSATNTSNSGPLGWGASSNAMLDTTSDGADLYAYSDFTSMPGGDAYVVADVTSIVQDWLSGTKPNYGVLIQVGNHNPYLSEAGSDLEPVLFLDVTLPQHKVTFNPGQTSQTIPVTIVNDTTGEYNETVQLTLSNPVNATLGANTTHTYTINDNDVLDCTATSQIPVYGTVGGALADTYTSNNVYESVREVLRTGYNYSWCEHKWVFNVRAGSSIQFRVEAYRPSNSDNDNFQFAYSLNDSTYTNMVTVTKSSDNHTDQTYSLPAGTSGTVYVRVRDTNRSNNRTSLDYVYIDRMVIRSNP